MYSSRQNTEFQTKETQPLETSLSAFGSGGDANVNGVSRGGEEAIARSLITNSLQVEECVDGTTKRPATDAFSNSRLKKKKSAQLSLAEAQAATLLQSIVPKLGPTFRLKPNDIDQLRKAVEEIRSGNQHVIDAGINYLLGWSLVEKGSISQEHVTEVLSVLIDFVTRTVTTKSTAAEELFEASQTTILISDAMQCCMAAGVIIKNIAQSLPRPVEIGTVNLKAARLIACLSTRTLPKIDGETVERTLTVDDVPLSLMRDVLHLVKVLPSLDGMEFTVISALIQRFCDRRQPLRLRTIALDVLSEFLYQESIKPILSQLIKQHSVNIRLSLKMFLMLTKEDTKKEAEFEFKGGLDYEGLAIFGDPEKATATPEFDMWKSRLRSEALLSATTFLLALTSTDLFESFVTDHYVLQVLVDLTTGKKLSDILQGDKSALESKREVMVTTKRHIQSSEMLAFRMIADGLEKTSSVIKDKLHAFEEQFVISAFDSTWQAKQCAMVLSLMAGHKDQEQPND